MDKGSPSSAPSVWVESWKATKAVIKVKTFQIIVLQGIVGTLPWTAMVFFTMWFELIGKYVNNKHTILYLNKNSACTEFDEIKTRNFQLEGHPLSK